MANWELPIDYVTLDYEGFFQMMKDNIPIITPEWTNTTDTDPGIGILRNLSYGLHILAYYENKATAENMLPTARTRRSILTLSNFLGYTPFGQTASKVDVLFTKEDAQLNFPVTIPAYTLIGTDAKLGNQVLFETDRSVTIPAGQMTALIPATQGQSVFDEDLGVGDNTEGQEFFLTYPNVLLDTVNLKTEENGAIYRWTRVESFIDSAPSDRHFVTNTTEDGLTVLTVGNGRTGMRIPYSIPVTVDYRYGGGSIGQVGAGKITSIVDDRLTGIASVNNLNAAVGGEDAESLESIQLMAPRAKSASGRAVNPTDFEYFGDKTPGIAKSKCVETYNDNDEVYLYLATETGTPVPQGIKDALQKEIEDVMISNQNLVLFDAIYKTFSVKATVNLRNNVLRDSAQTAIIQAIQNAYRISNLNFGDDIYRANMINVIFNAAVGVINVTLDPSVVDVICDVIEIPRLLTVELQLIGGVS